MKKSLIALAVMAASGAAMAQSSVTAYGLIDVWFGTVKAGGVTNTVLNSGGVNGSRWGLKGSEDLGGGLKANFLLEQGFGADTGAGAVGQAFSRQSYVGVSGGFGEVKLGKVWTAYDDVSGASNSVFDSALAATNGVFLSGNYNANPGNTIYYATPAFGGVTAALSYSLGENKTPAVGASSITSVNVAYAGGPLAAQFAYQVEDVNTAADDTSYTRLGASYDFGVVAAKVSYGKVSNIGNVSGADATEYQIGADVPLSSAMTLSAGYAKSTDNAKAGDATRKGYGIAVAYTLSKRTFVYGGFHSDKTTPKVGAEAKTDIFAVGLQHKF